MPFKPCGPLTTSAQQKLPTHVGYRYQRHESAELLGSLSAGSGIGHDPQLAQELHDIAFLHLQGAGCSARCRWAPSCSQSAGSGVDHGPQLPQEARDVVALNLRPPNSSLRVFRVFKFLNPKNPGCFIRLLVLTGLDGCPKLQQVLCLCRRPLQARLGVMAAVQAALLQAVQHMLLRHAWCLLATITACIACCAGGTKP